jgi:predicted ferric reductase
MITPLLLIISQIPLIVFLLQNDAWDQRLIGLAFGYSALSCFILTALLSFRAPLMERLFGWLDRLYKAHHLMGLLTVGFIVIHILIIFLSSESVSFLLDPTVMSFDYLSGWLSLILLVTVIILASSLNKGHKLLGATHLFKY